MLAWAGSLAALWVATCSPLAMLHHELLTAHMAQHILLSLVAAPLILLGGRPRRAIAHPTICWAIGVGTFIAWHIPALFALAFQSQRWHALEQATFVGSGVLFWWPVVQSGHRTPRWWIPLYLFLAMLPCDALSAFLTFSDRVLYPMYLSVPHPFALAPLQDQECAGAVMWVSVTVAYALPAAIVTVNHLSPPAGTFNSSAHRRSRPCPTSPAEQI